MIESLEARRLAAASAGLKRDVLAVVGTNESDRIAITALVGVTTTTYRYVDGERDGPMTAFVQYAVTVNGRDLGTFTDVKRINVFALGGNDRVNGPYIDPLDQKVLLGAAALVFAGVYVEGGSGRDKLYGGSGNDTLKGGRGHDLLVDAYGRNYFDGGPGDDRIDAVVNQRTYEHGRPVYT